jgi:hypothetical protein
VFRIYLEKKISSGQSETNKVESPPIRPSRTRNRRLFERYNVDHYHLTVLNDQDILVVRDLSAKGFSSDVSERAFMRFNLGDVYSAKLRYLGEVYDVKVKVSWKQSKVVGFEVIDADTDFLKFLGRVIRPIKIGSSMKQIRVDELENSDLQKLTLKGDFNTHIYIWKKAHVDDLEAWQLVMGEEFVEWSSSSGTTTGSLEAKPLFDQSLGLSNEKSSSLVPDKKINERRKRLAIDIFAALNVAFRDDLLATLER